MKKLIILIILLFATIASAQETETTFNAFTSQLDYILDIDNLTVDIKTTATVTGGVVSFEGGTYDTYLYAGIPTSSEYYRLPLTDGTNAQVLHTDGAGNLYFDTDDGAGGGAPTDADYLVGTANGSLSAEIVVGTTPGGELGGTWASPTIDDSLTVANWTLTTPNIGVATATSVNASDTVTGIVVDTQYLEYSSGGAVTVRDNLDTQSYDLVHEFTRCASIENLAAADDNVLLGAFTNNVTITKVGCSYVGTGTTPATITLEDGNGNAMTHGTVTCTVSTSDITFTNVTAANTLNAGEPLRFDVSNAVSPETDEYLICVGMTE